MKLSIFIFSLLLAAGSAILQRNNQGNPETETETKREAMLAQKTEEPEIKLTPYQDAIANHFIVS